MRLYHPTEIVIESLDVLFAEQPSPLHFDDHQVLVAGRGAMQSSYGDGEAVSRGCGVIDTLAINIATAAGDNPVFAAMLMALQADATTGQDAEAFDQITLAKGQVFKPSPGPLNTSLGGTIG
jgi:hypothetical protein